MMKQSPITPYHLRKGAEMINEEGWNMPGRYTDVLQEHTAMRAACGVFDISHLAKFTVTGPGAQEWLESMLSNTIATCHDGCGQQTLMLNENGGIIDRLTLFRETAGRFFLLGSAAMAQEDGEWLAAHRPDGPLEVLNETEKLSAIAVYGPESGKVFRRMFPGLEPPEPMTVRRVIFRNEELILTSACMEGDVGFEVFCAANRGIARFESAVQLGAVPCGMQTRECVRMERGRGAYGRDMNSRTSPAQAGLSHLCAADKTYPGSAAVQKADAAPDRQLTPLQCDEAGSPAPQRGNTVKDEQGRSVGSVTGGCISPTTGCGIGLAYLATRAAKPGTHLTIIIGGVAVPATVSTGGVS